MSITKNKFISAVLIAVVLVVGAVFTIGEAQAASAPTISYSKVKSSGKYVTYKVTAKKPSNGKKYDLTMKWQGTVGHKKCTSKNSLTQNIKIKKGHSVTVYAYLVAKNLVVEYVESPKAKKTITAR